MKTKPMSEKEYLKKDHVSRKNKIDDRELVINIMIVLITLIIIFTLCVIVLNQLQYNCELNPDYCYIAINNVYNTSMSELP